MRIFVQFSVDSMWELGECKMWIVGKIQETFLVNQCRTLMAHSYVLYCVHLT